MNEGLVTLSLAHGKAACPLNFGPSAAGDYWLAGGGGVGFGAPPMMRKLPGPSSSSTRRRSSGSIATALFGAIEHHAAAVGQVEPQPQRLVARVAADDFAKRRQHIDAVHIFAHADHHGIGEPRRQLLERNQFVDDQIDFLGCPAGDRSSPARPGSRRPSPARRTRRTARAR